MIENPFRRAGSRIALPQAGSTAMKIPFLIFLVSGLATLQLEPLATRGVEILFAITITSAAAHPGDNRINCLREELADVQLDLMKVLETDHAVTERLEAREASLKYAIRAAQVRRDELAQRRMAGSAGTPQS